MNAIRVIVPLDGSELAETALRYVPVLACLGPLRVRLVAVAEDAEAYSIPNAEAWQDRQVRLLREYLKGVPRRIEGVDIEIESAVRRGNPAEVLVTDAHRFKADFMLLSTHGRSGPSRWRVGSVADKVIRSVRCNTLAIGPATYNGHNRTTVRSIMVPLDGSELAEAALPMASHLADALRAQLHLVEAVNQIPTEMFAGFDIADIDLMAKEYLQKKASEYWHSSPKVSVVNGPAAEALLFYAGQEAIDLVVVTSHGRGGLLRSALGSVTDRLIGGSAPVLIVRKDLALQTPEKAPAAAGANGGRK
ncbi:MAG: universal stress protein [Dehalococcoidia bacterium]